MLACTLPQQAREQSPPRLAEYARTLKALERYRILAEEDDGAPLPETEEPVNPGDHYEGVQRLNTLLTRLGDLPANAALDDPDMYTPALVTAIQRFQISPRTRPHRPDRPKDPYPTEYSAVIQGPSIGTRPGALAS
jgi:hypothetical protein